MGSAGDRGRHDRVDPVEHLIGQGRSDLRLDAVLVWAAATIPGNPGYVDPILQAALDGLRA